MTVTRRKRGQAHEPHTSKFLDFDYHSPRCVLKSHLRGVNNLHSVCVNKKPRPDVAVYHFRTLYPVYFTTMGSDHKYDWDLKLPAHVPPR